MRLDKKLQQQITTENYKKIFNDLIKSKTDKLTNDVRLAMGVDGNDYENIEKNIDLFSKTFCNRASKGKYIFSPFREIQIPKAPYSKFEFKEAEKAGKLRTLAISTINDTILQKMIYNTIYEYMEKKYNCIDSNIYGYRKGKSVKQAIEKIQSYFLQGYTYGIDGDLEKYFDKINHDRLNLKINNFFKNDILVKTYLYRFLKVKRVKVENKKLATKYYHEKPIADKRDLGIPQGGVLSGLLANLYLYNFDKYVVYNLGSKYDLKYIRYADDFIILCKDKSIIMDLYKKINSYFNREKLHLHTIDSSSIDNSEPNNNKTKAINLENQHYIEFLGFRISKRYLGIKRDNITKFKKVIKHIIDVGIQEKADVGKVIYKINAKLLGNWIYGKGYFVPCEHCSKPQKPQSWIGFFINTSDMRQLKLLDVWIRKQIRHFWFVRYGIRPERNYLRKPMLCPANEYYNCNVVSLFKEACYIKTYLKKHEDITFCECEHYEPIVIPYS